METAIDHSFIHVLRDLRDISFLPPNRREFYKIMLIAGGTGMLIVGGNTYSIDKPVVLFVPPNQIISWKNLSMTWSAYCALFNRAFVIKYQQFKAMLDKFGLFSDKRKSLICLNDSEVHSLRRYFEKMGVKEEPGDVYREDTIQALLQLIVVESIKAVHFLIPDGNSDECPYSCQFFDLLRKETSDISYTNPIRIRTVKEFANDLHMHPNYLNVLLKKQTGQNVSTHIRNRLLEEAKMLLLYTNWSLHEITYSLGFSEQSNFNIFFKKNTGLTPAKFRRGM